MTEETPLQELENEPTAPVVDATEETKEVTPEAQEAERVAKNDARLAQRNKTITKNWRKSQAEAAELRAENRELKAKNEIKVKPEKENYYDNEEKYATDSQQWDAQVREKIRAEERAAIETETGKK